MPAPEILVTIAIPTRNRPSGLRAALESALNQSYPGLEIIVSDNNTVEDVKPVVEGFHDPRVKYFRHDQTLDMAANWNFCLGKASGDFFLLLSDDDFLFPEAVERLLAAARRCEAAFSYGRAIFEDEGGRRIGTSHKAPQIERGREFIRESLAARRQALPSFTLFRTASARALGGYPETGNSTDLALRLSLALSGPVTCASEPLGVYRLHSGSMTGDVDKTIESFGALAEWSARAENPLAGWKDAIRGYCASSLLTRARSSALRGEKSAAWRLMAKASELRCWHWYDRLILHIFSLRLAGLLAILRRKVSVKCLHNGSKDKSLHG